MMVMIVVVIALMFLDVRGGNISGADNDAGYGADNNENDSKGFWTDRGFVIAGKDEDDDKYDDEHSGDVIWQSYICILAHESSSCCLVVMTLFVVMTLLSLRVVHLKLHRDSRVTLIPKYILEML